MATRQLSPVMCPVCGARFMAPIETIIDASRAPNLKTQLLQGRLNIIQCPQCGRQSAMTAPLFYHDPAHQLALVLVPTELSLHNTDQQKLIGDLTNALMTSLPAEQRKGYLLTPQVFFTMQSMVNTILQAEGITPEMVERQRAKAKLMETFLQAPDENALRSLVKEHDAELDYEFFEILTASAQAAHGSGQAELARALLGLRAVLAEWSSKGHAAVAEINAAMGLGETITREELLKRLQTAQSEDEWQTLVAAGRPLLDYAFFQSLTAQVEAAADADTASRLKSLRSRILDTTAQQDADVRTAMKAASDLLKEILQAQDLEAAVRQHLAEIDDLFFAVLSANLDRAQADNLNDWVQRLRQVGDLAMKLLEEQLPPEVRLVNQLLLAAHPDGSQQLLLQHQALITPQFLVTLDQLIAELDASGQTAAAKRLRQVQAQAKPMVQGVLQA